MKRLALLAVLLAIAAPAWSQAFVQGTTNCSFGGTNNNTVTIGGGTSSSCPTGTGWVSNTTAGNTLAGFIWRKPGSGFLQSVADGGDLCFTVNPWGTVVGTAATGHFVIYGWYCENIAGGTKPTITATFANNEDTWYTLAHEISGLATSLPLDGYKFVPQNFVGSGTNAGTTGNWTTSSNGDYIMGGFMDDDTNGRTITAGTLSITYTARVPVDNTHTESMFSEDGIQSTASNTTVTTFTTNGGTNPLMGAMAFRAAGVPVTNPHSFFNKQTVLHKTAVF